MPEEARYKMRRFARFLHLFCGLSLGVVLSVICLSGALVVYKPSLEKQCIREKAYLDSFREQIPLLLETLLQNVRLEYPAYHISNMVIYGDRDEAYSFRTTKEGEKGRRQIYVNQYTGQVLGEDVYNTKFMQWVYDLHTDLFLGKAGRVIVGSLGLFLLLMILTGIALLPPRLRPIVTLKSRNSKYMTRYRRHIIIGLMSAVPLAVIALTGAYWGFPRVYQSAFEAITQSQAVPDRPLIERNATGSNVSLDQIVRSARDYYPEGEPTMIFFPKSETAPFSVRMKHPHDYSRTGSNHVYIHPQTGDVVAANLWETKPAAEKLVRSMYFIHFGEFWGHCSRILWMITGFLVPVLYFSGLYLWYVKFTKNHRQ